MKWTFADRFDSACRNGLCSNCNLPLRERKGKTERAINTRIVIEFEGEIEFCETCVKEVAVGLLGYSPPEDLENLKTKIRELKKTNDDISKQLAEKVNAIEVIMKELVASA